MTRIDIPPGTVFGRYTVIEEGPPRNGSRTMICECACKRGKQRIVTVRDLRSGHSTSCGCSRRRYSADLSHLKPGEIPLYGKHARGRIALVDLGDYELVMQYRWLVREVERPGRRTLGPYAIAKIRRDGHNTTIFMHNLIMGRTRIDHANGNGLDNRRSNLRPATNGQNMGNRRPNLNHSSQYKGVQWAPNCNKWRANIKVDGTKHTLGFFADEREAAEAYDAAARVAFGEFARPNFPEVA